jgi:hypothetical protein
MIDRRTDVVYRIMLVVNAFIIAAMLHTNCVKSDLLLTFYVTHNELNSHEISILHKMLYSGYHDDIPLAPSFKKFRCRI